MKVGHLLHPPGVSIAFVGADGAGKTSLSAAVAAAAPSPVVGIYMGLHQAGARRAGLPLLLAHRTRCWLRGRLAQAHGQLVVYDRYAVDALLQRGDLPTRRRRLRRWLLAHAAPLPDVLVLLDTPGAVLHDRTAAAGGPQACEEQRQRYLALRSRVPQLQVLDARRPLPELCAEVLTLLRTLGAAKEEATTGEGSGRARLKRWAS